MVRPKVGEAEEDEEGSDDAVERWEPKMPSGDASALCSEHSPPSPVDAKMGRYGCRATANAGLTVLS